MTPQEARNLLPRTVVMWGDDPEDKGTVTFVGHNALSITWETGLVAAIRYQDAGMLRHWRPNSANRGQLPVVSPQG